MPAPTPMPDSKEHGKHFTNPYNFVSWELPLKEKRHLYRQPYVALDRYSGNSGRIRARLTTVTPFFVPTGQPEEMSVNEATKLKSKAFLRLPHPITGEAVPAVQASSLKGMLRSLVETVTNSCFAVFEPEQHFSHRASPTPLPLGIVSKQDDNWILEKLDSARVSIKANKTLLNELNKRDGWNGQTRAAAKVISQPGKPYIKNAEGLKILADKDTAPNGLKEGWLKATGEDLVENKRHEKFVYRSNGEVYRIPQEVVVAYNQVLAEQNSPDPQRRNNFHTCLPHDELTAGDIVYFREQPKSSQGLRTVAGLGSVAVPRWQYRNPVGFYLPDELHTCQKLTSLCPACRLFGWVRDSHKEGGSAAGKNDGNNAAVMGRVFFSHAYAQKPILQQSRKILAILSSPKPTTTPFYLVNDKQPDRDTDYDQAPDPVWLRGRKFFWHYKPTEKQYVFSNKKKNGPLQYEQNIEVELLGVDESVTFEFSIDFVNLTDQELGVLLWVLEFDDEPQSSSMRHKLGMGKPLGLGTVHIEVAQLELRDKVAAYQPENLFSPPLDTNPDRRVFKTAFKQYMKEMFGQDFEELYNIQELRAILDVNSITHPLEVHYPYLPDRRDPSKPDESKPESFRWFVQNNRRRIRHLDPYTMPRPDEEVNKPDYRLPNLPD